MNLFIALVVEILIDYSTLMLFPIQKTIPLQDVTDVRKAKTAAIFPNAIEIVAGAKRHFFGSFLARDDAYRVIVDGWEQHVSDARLLIERQDAKSASSSDENGYVLLEEGKESKQDDDSSPLNRSASPTAVMSGNTDCGDSDTNTSNRVLEVPEDGTEENAASLNPFSLEPFDNNAPNGLFELPFFCFLILLTVLLVFITEVFCLATFFPQYPNPIL
jgi:hypothetical protein